MGYYITQKFDRCLYNGAAHSPIRFQSDKLFTSNLTALRLHHIAVSVINYGISNTNVLGDTIVYHQDSDYYVRPWWYKKLGH